MKVSNNFTIQEFVPKAVYEQWGVSSMWFVDPRIISLAQFFRDHFGSSITINNWHTGGKYSERGFRLPDTKTGGALSQHKFGRAVDMSISGQTPETIFKEVKENENLFLAKGLTTVENPEFTPSWFHVDIRVTGLNKLLVVNPR
jgi:hypothetical protein